MEILRYIENSLEECRNATLKMAEGLTQEQLRWQPSPEANHIAFLLWHIARTEDNFIRRCRKSQTGIWDTQGWNKKFNLSPTDSGFGFTTEQVKNFPKVSLEDILGYIAAVRKNTLEYIHSITPDRLEDSIIERPFSVGQALMRITLHESEHRGQIDYLLGLMKSQSRRAP